MLKIHSYESMGTVDGPGLRFVIFMQGCNFKCLYCANPDTINLNGGTEISDDEIFQMVFDMKPYFGRRGGVTFSGGETTLQARELIPLIKRFKQAGIHTCIDSNAGVWNKDVEELFSLVDLVLLDIKQINPTKHKALTGHSNDKPLHVAKWLEDNSKPFWLRHVLVPGISTDKQDLIALAETFKDYKMIQQVEVLPYHRLGVHKYEAMGLEYSLKDVEPCSNEQLAEAEQIFNKYFNCVTIC